MIFLKIGNTKKPIAEWGCENPQLIFNSFNPDEFSFTTSLLNFRTAWMEFETRLEVFQDSTRVFAGFLQEPAVNKSGGGDNVQVSAKGFWDVFDSTYYKNTWEGNTVSGSISSVNDATKTQLFGRKVEIGYGSTSGAYVLDEATFVNNWSAQGFMTDEVIPAFNQTNSSELFAMAPANISVNSDLILPFEEKVAPTYADVFSSVLKWHPDLMSWFDYSKDKPQLFVKAQAVCENITVNIADTTEISLSKDIKRHRNVILRILKYITGTSGMSWRKYKGYEDYCGEGITAQQRNVLIVPIDTCGEGYANNTLNRAALHSQLKKIVNSERYSGSVTICDRNLATRYVGKILNISGSVDDLSKINAQIQSDAINLMDGTRTLTLGSDNQSDCSDFVSRIEWLMGEKKTDLYISNQSS